MTKSVSIFKILAVYFRSYPRSVMGWIWVSVAPLVGSGFLASWYFLVEKVRLEYLYDHFLLSIGLAFILGLALLPTTLSAVAIGFFWGWTGFLDLILGYILANMLGFWLGKRLNSGFMEILYAKNQRLKKEIDTRINDPAGLIFFVRISPAIPFAISNFLFASLNIPLKKVLFFGIPGMLPRTFLAFSSGMIANSFSGAKETLNHPLQWVSVIILLMVSLTGIYFTWKKARN